MPPPPDLNNVDKISFFLCLVMADFEEIYDDPFGTVHLESVAIGLGASNGISLVKDLILKEQAKDSAGDQEKKRWERQKLPKSDHESVLQTLLEHFVNRAKVDPTFREIMGWYLAEHSNKNTGSVILNREFSESDLLPGTIDNVLNGRPVNSVDAEAILCKLATIIQRNSGSRSTSNSPPQQQKSDCHPFPIEMENCVWDDDLVRLVMRKGLLSYWVNQKDYSPIPECIGMFGEHVPLAAEPTSSQSTPRYMQAAMFCIYRILASGMFSTKMHNMKLHS